MFVMCRLFQNAVSKNALQFKGNAQHDAQEFLLWLLDRVHEDINTVNSRPPIKVKLADTTVYHKQSILRQVFTFRYTSSSSSALL